MLRFSYSATYSKLGIQEVKVGLHGFMGLPHGPLHYTLSLNPSYPPKYVHHTCEKPQYNIKTDSLGSF